MRRLKKCPDCKHTHKVSKTKCEKCGSTFDTTAVRKGKYGISTEGLGIAYGDDEENEDIALLKEFGYLD